ncbi:HesA/MoeB/ThiF family protein [Ferrimonas pelagia]|uniref:HesA/MoeB/ThiF family protein n=1 Tax=Ferrimonas pelagia TaxID=1177826 RepID=A0ABP9FCT4_9GAMM
MLNDEAYLRFGRQLLLPEWGEAGQQRLADKRVLVIGLGGLGCPALQYLAGAGIGAGERGALVLMDGDRISLSNLPRQTLYRADQIGQSKAQAAKAWAKQHNPGIRVEALAQMASAEGLPKRLAGIDLVLDCTDNLASRHAINRACVRAGVPLISGAAIGWQGQLMVIEPGAVDAPCFACFSDPADSADAASCREAGVVGPVVGAVGTLQALMALRLLLGLPPEHKLHRFDGLTVHWQAFKLAKADDCPLCGSAAEERV